MARKRGKKTEAQKYEGYLYSTIGTPLPAAGAIAAFAQPAFSYGIGAAGFPAGIQQAAATVVHTNMAVGNQLPDGVAFVAKELGFYARGQVDYRDLRNLFENTVATMMYDNRQQQRDFGPVLLWPGGVGVDASIAVDGAAVLTETFVANNGSPFVGARRKLKTPIPLKGRRNFDMTINCPVALAGIVGVAPIEIVACLYGVYFNKVGPT